MHNYPSDITREQFEIIRLDLEQAKKKTRPRKYDLYDIFCAVLYVLRGGIQWRMLSKDFPSWKLVYYYFTVWTKADENGVSLLDKILKKLVEIERFSNGRNLQTSFIIIDSKSVKNTNTAKEKGYDAGKKVSGMKLHLAVDIMGLPQAIYVTKADVTDRNGAIEMVLLNLNNLSCVKNMLVDSGYSGKNFANVIKKIHGSDVEVVKKSKSSFMEKLRTQTFYFNANGSSCLASFDS